MWALSSSALSAPLFSSSAFFSSPTSSSTSPRVPFLNSRTPLPRPLASSGMRFAPKRSRMITSNMINSVPPTLGIIYPPNRVASRTCPSLYGPRARCRSLLLDAVGGLPVLEQVVDALLEGVGLLAFGIALEVAVPVPDRLALLPGLLVSLPRQQVRLEIVLPDLRGGGVGVPGLLVCCPTLLLVRHTLRFPVVGLAQVERDDRICGGGLAAPLQNLHRAVRLSILQIEAGKAPYDLGVLGVSFEVFLGAGYLLIGTTRWLFLPSGAAAQDI